MRKLIAISTLASFACFTLVDMASAQVAVEAGTEFPAAPMSKGGFSLSAPSQVIAPAAAPGPDAAPAPEPVAPRKRRKRRR